MISRKKDKLLDVSSRVHESGTPSGEYLLIYTARLPIHFGLEAFNRARCFDAVITVS